VNPDDTPHPVCDGVEDCPFVLTTGAHSIRLDFCFLQFGQTISESGVEWDITNSSNLCPQDSQE
jgi:hypothetical protein